MIIDFLTSPFGRYIDLIPFGSVEPELLVVWANTRTGEYAKYLHGKRILCKGRWSIAFDGPEIQRRAWERWLNPPPKTAEAPV